MTWFYRTVTFLPEKRNNEVIVGKCLRVLHGFNWRYGTRGIGASFPLWCEETVGNQLTFVSHEMMQLDFLLRQSHFVDMARIGYFSISNMKEVPENCDFVAYERKDSIDRLTAVGQEKRLRRHQVRAEARGEIFNPEKHQPKSKQNVVPHYHSIDNISENNFSLNIVRVDVSIRSTIGSGLFSSYGLANSDKGYQVVPNV